MRRLSGIVRSGAGLKALFDAYGPEPERERIAYYRLLYDLVS